MKKIIVTLLSIALLLSLAGCHAVTPSGSSSSFGSPSSVSLTSSKAQSAASSVDPSAMTATNGTPENHITYLFGGYGISFMKQGKQMLSGDGGDQCDVFDMIYGAPEGDLLKKYYFKDMYAQGTTIPKASGELLYPAFTNDFLTSNGDWDFFPTKVRYEKFTLENQPNDPEWNDYFMSRIKEKSDETPLIYADAYYFDWNGDGIEDAFVNASNTFWSSGDSTLNLPKSDKTISYTISTLFVSGNIPLETCMNYTSYISKEPLENEDVHLSYNMLKPYRDNPFICAIQYDSEGNLIQCPVFNAGEDFGRFDEDEMVLCDIDGDGKSEFIRMNIEIYSYIIVYKLIDGKPVEVFRVAMGA